MGCCSASQVLAIHQLAPVAQLDSASVFGTEGYRFESCRACWTYVKSPGPMYLGTSDHLSFGSPRRMSSTSPPSKEEILQKYRDLISEDDFEILLSEPPSPAELQNPAFQK